MVVILVDRGAFPRLARTPAITAKILTPAFTAATGAAPAAFTTTWLKIPPLLAAATLSTAFTATATLATIVLALASTRTLTATTSTPTNIMLTRRRLSGCRRGRSRSRFSRGDFFAQLREEFSEHNKQIKLPNLS